MNLTAIGRFYGTATGAQPHAGIPDARDRLVAAARSSMIDGAHTGGCRAAPFHTVERQNTGFRAFLLFTQNALKGMIGLSDRCFFSLVNRRSIVCLSFLFQHREIES